MRNRRYKVQIAESGKMDVKQKKGIFLNIFVTGNMRKTFQRR